VPRLGGVAGEPFYIDPTVLGAIRKAVANGSTVDLTGWSKEKAANAFANTTVSSIIIEVPDSEIGAGTIGFWGVTALPTGAGGWRQINRAGQPMIQPIFNPDDGEQRAPTQHHQPKEDRELDGFHHHQACRRRRGPMGTSADPRALWRVGRASALPDICDTRSARLRCSALRSGRQGATDKRAGSQCFRSWLTLRSPTA